MSIFGFYLRLFLHGTWMAVFSIVLFFTAVPYVLILKLFKLPVPDLNQIYAALVTLGSKIILGFRFDIQGIEKLEKSQPCIYILNHQSNVDVFTFAAIYPRHTILIGKKELRVIPLFGQFYQVAGNLLIDRKNRSQAVAGLDQAVESLKREGKSIFIFPEGTRNKTSEPLGPFKKGAFYMAIQAGVPLVPIIGAPIQDVFDLKTKKIKPGPYRIRVLDPIPTQGMSHKEVEPLLESTRNLMLTALQDLK